MIFVLYGINFIFQIGTGGLNDRKRTRRIEMKGDCKHLTFYGQCKLGHNENNEEMCIDCEDYEEEE